MPGKKPGTQRDTHMWQLSVPALLLGVSVGVATEALYRRCRRAKGAKAAEGGSETVAAAPKVATKGGGDDVFRPPAPALPVLTMKQLRALNTKLGTPMKNKLLI